MGALFKSISDVTKEENRSNSCITYWYENRNNLCIVFYLKYAWFVYLVRLFGIHLHWLWHSTVVMSEYCYVQNRILRLAHKSKTCFQSGSQILKIWFDMNQILNGTIKLLNCANVFKKLLYNTQKYKKYIIIICSTVQKYITKTSKSIK